MTESEAQKWLEKFEWDDSEETSDALATICEALQEYPKFKAIGTIEEFKSFKDDFWKLNEMCREYSAIGTIERFRELTEKAEPKKLVKPSGLSDKFHHIELCPSCKARFRVHRARNRYTEVVVEMNYWPECGQRLDWE